MRHNGLPTRSKHQQLKFLLCVFCAVIILNEYVIYYIQSRRWPTLPETDRASKQVILLVADPQIQGYQNEIMNPVGTLARWDVDRYLRTMFSYAYNYCEPDVVVFLGDLFDEGSRATPREYAATMERFASIFQQTRYTKTIYIPGDNDIGGESKDIQTHRKTKRFQEHFGNMTDLIKFGFIDYMKLDLTSYGMTDEKVRAAEALKQKKTSPLSILLNHNTIMPHPKHFVYPVTRRLRPKLIFSAHWHKAWVYTCNDCLADNEYDWAVKHNDLSEIDDYLRLNLDQEDYLCEIAVPTCSYRMGEVNIGYGVAILGEDYTLEYTVLWLPRRYTMLLGYLIVVVICGIIYCVNRCTVMR